MSQLSDRQRHVYKQLRDDYPLFSKHCLKIRTKSGEVKKARQQGFSTYVNGRGYHKTTHRRGFRTFILSHEQTASEELFSMVDRFHENIQYDMKPSTSAANAKELYFDKLDSGYKVGTAGNKATGRGSTIQFFHGSEVAFWPNDKEHMAGVLQAVPDLPDTEIILESTGNGMANMFYELSMGALRGENDYILIFVPWFMSNEYRSQVPKDFVLSEEDQEYKSAHKLVDEQMAWRASKIKELGKYKFMQEYPATPQEAFQTSGEDTYIMPDIVMKARKRPVGAFGPVVLGVDPASDGKDRTAFVWRKGMKQIGSDVKRFDEMETVGYIIHEINAGVDQVNIDAIGIGSGIVSRLKELGFGNVVKAVKGSNSPDDKEKYLNKRVECWGRMKEWLGEGQIEDDDALHLDLTSLLWKYNSNGQVQLESKQELRKRGVSSPDLADALSYTFAYPVAPTAREGRKIRVKKDNFSI